jgi:hypothetical protein
MGFAQNMVMGEWWTTLPYAVCSPRKRYKAAGLEAASPSYWWASLRPRAAHGAILRFLFGYIWLHFFAIFGLIVA